MERRAGAGKRTTESILALQPLEVRRMGLPVPASRHQHQKRRPIRSLAIALAVAVALCPHS
jgi:hypothetical protein